MKLVFYAAVLVACLWCCACGAVKKFENNFYLISVSRHGETDKFIHYNRITAKESMVKSPNDK